MAKIGIMGGTFNPIHIGHIEMAENAKKRLNLEKVFFITGGNTPHKDANGILDAKIRHEMVEKSVKKIKGLEALDYEIKKDGFSYTAETLAYLKEKYPKDDLYFILGADSLDYIDKWHKPEEIFRLAKLAVFDRNKYDSRKKADELLEKYKGQIIYLDGEITDISSTKIRLFVDMGLDISKYVPKQASEIIKKKKLYLGKYTKLREEMEKVLEPKRFLHTLGVAKTAVAMAEEFGEDIEKAYVAGILHDCAKNIPTDEMFRLCEENNVELDEFERTHPVLVHAKLGAYLAKAKYGVEDEDIINAIMWHTLGRCEMSKLEKIVFVADMAEEGRTFIWAELLRLEAFRNLDRAMLMSMDETIKYNEKKGFEVHKAAYRVRRHFKDLVGE